MKVILFKLSLIPLTLLMFVLCIDWNRHVFEVNCDPNLGVAQTALLDSQVTL